MPHSMPPHGARAIIYCRISRDREGAGLAVERQREDCEELATQLRLEVVAVYDDNDLSAYSGKPRPGYDQMLEDLRAGKADVVLAWHTDRLHRSPIELEEYIDVCQPRGVATRTVRAGHLDLTTAAGRMIARQLGVQARYEVELKAERQRSKRDQMAAAGEHFGGPRPFGYETDGILLRAVYCATCGLNDADDFTTVVVCSECEARGGFDGWECQSCHSPHGRAVKCVCRRCGGLAAVAPESEAAVIREAAEAILAGASLRAVCRDWEERGIRTVPRSKRLPDGTRSEPVARVWQAAELRGLLLRPRNAGIRQHRGKEAGPAKWPPILDEVTWRSLCAILTDPDRRTTPGNERKWLGSGIYLCGVCGQTVRCSTSGTGAGTVHMPAYRCRSLKHVTRRCDLLDKYVTLLILDRVSRPDAADLLAEREDPVDVRGAQADMREARATLDQLAAALGRGELDMQSWRIASAAAQARLKGAEDTLSRAVRANPVLGLVGADDPAAVWKRMDLSRRRAVVAWLMVVTVHPARKGRLPGGARLDTDSIEVVWR